MSTRPLDDQAPAPSAGGFGRAVALRLTAAATTWATLLGWAALSEDAASFLGPLLLLALLVAALGVLGRTVRAGAAAVLLGQCVLAGGAALQLIAAASPSQADLPDRIREAFSQASLTAGAYAAPIPAEAPPIAPVLIMAGLGCLVAVDFLACGVRRPSLAGLPLLAVLVVPLTLTGTGTPLVVFLASAIGYLCLLHLHQQSELTRWGRLDSGAEAAVSRESIQSAAAGIGSVSIVAAIGLALVVPTFSVSLFEGRMGSGTGGDIEIENPMTDLKRDLLRGPDRPMLTVSTDDPDPSYLRIAVLSRLNEEEWSSGDREVPPEQLAQGPMPALAGVDPSVPRREYDWRVRSESSFDSIWLPTSDAISQISAPGDWRYDLATMDFLSGDKDDTAASLSYRFRRVVLDRDALAMANAASSAGGQLTAFLNVPRSLDNRVRPLARQVTQGASTRFERAQLLQDWFRNTGGFRYNDSYTGQGTLTSFLFDDAPEGRTGYCEQFSAAMAVMARTLGIPSRVAVGFLSGEKTGPDDGAESTYTFSSHDLHAWPELYFAGSGWVRFEPTPADRAPDVPDYSVADVPDRQQPSVSAPTARPSDELPSRGADPEEQAAPEETAAGEGGPVPWAVVGWTLAAAALLALVLLGPRTLRRLISERRWRRSPPVEAAWAQVRDHAADLGVPWPAGASPRATAASVSRSFDPDVAPTAMDALERIVHQVELARFSRAAAPVSTTRLRADVEAVRDGWERGASQRARRLARWLPRSLTTAGRAAPPPAAADVESRDRVVDHLS